MISTQVIFCKKTFGVSLDDRDATVSTGFLREVAKYPLLFVCFFRPII